MSGGTASRFALLLLPLASCAPVRQPTPLPPAQVEVTADPVPVDWKSVITPADQERLARIDEAWTQGLAAARRYRTAIAKECPLLDPKSALPRAAPPPGPYLCRIVKLGGRPAFIAYKPFKCFVEAEGELLTMVKQTGTQRPAGRLWTDNDARQVFLGGLSAGDNSPPPYANDPNRDVAGFLERVGPFRWRLAVPLPQGGPTLDVYELVPIVETGA